MNPTNKKGRIDRLPIISQFYGIIITMYVNEEKHHKPHIHIRYNEYKEVMDFDGNILGGKVPYKQNQLVKAWVLIHREELESLWRLVQDENDYFKIEPLK